MQSASVKGLIALLKKQAAMSGEITERLVNVFLLSFSGGVLPGSGLDVHDDSSVLSV